MNVPPDFFCDPSLKGKLRYTHRRTRRRHGNLLRRQQDRRRRAGHVRFRAADGRPELWQPQTGRTEQLAVLRTDCKASPRHAAAARTARVGVRRLSARAQQTFDPVVSVMRNGHRCLRRYAGYDENRGEEGVVRRVGRSGQNARRDGKGSGDRRRRRTAFRGVAARRRRRSRPANDENALGRLHRRRPAAQCDRSGRPDDLSGRCDRSAADRRRENAADGTLLARSVAKRTLRTEDGFRPDVAVQRG